MKPSSAVRRDARKRASSGVVRSDQQEVEKILRGDVVTGAQIRRGRVVDVGALHGDRSRERHVAFEEDERRHHLGDARDRSLFLRVRLPEHLIGLGVVDDGGLGADVGHFFAELIDLEARRRELAHRLGAAPRHVPARGVRRVIFCSTSKTFSVDRVGVFWVFVFEAPSTAGRVEREACAWAGWAAPRSASEMPNAAKMRTVLSMVAT